VRPAMAEQVSRGRLFNDLLKKLRISERMVKTTNSQHNSQKSRDALGVSELNRWPNTWGQVTLAS
jgi:hypothetical protein